METKGQYFTASEQRAHGLELLRQMLGQQADFRPGQWDAIETIALKKQRGLVVQRTGWGKSIVYFLATKLLREHGAGPTLLISPLLSLMRNQIAMAERIGIRAVTIHSANQDQWETIEQSLVRSECDILLVSPERLSNPRFRADVLPRISGRIGLLVVDEAHCISDWGHDFRPDYRRIVRIINLLPRGIPVLGTTATANDRVVNDIVLQLGPDLIVQRGPLVRTSLSLQNIQLASQAERLAWLAENIPRLPGSGIVYCLTVADTERVAAWLRLQGIEAEAYHARLESDRQMLEEQLIHNRLKVLVATVALGMGFDKPDLGFVIHFQRPGSVVAYYQQVGRAGRAVSKAYGILLSGQEEDDILEFFINSAFPPVDLMERILTTLDQYRGLPRSQIQQYVNAPVQVIENALKILEVDGAVSREGNRYSRTLNSWQPNQRRIENVTRQRWTELEQMQAYVRHQGCLMEFLERALDDSHPAPCGKCANCVGRGLPVQVKSNHLLTAAETFTRNYKIDLSPRKQWPPGVFPEQSRRIPTEGQLMPGRALCYYGDAGWGRLVQDGKYLHDHFCDQLLSASVELVQSRWDFAGKPPLWVTAIPSLRRPKLVEDFAKRLSFTLRLPFAPVFKRTCNAPEQKSMQNSSMQARNVISSLTIDPKAIRPGQPVLLVDDIWDSGWTMTYAGWLLRTNHSGLVYPLTLARTNGRG